MKVVAVVACRRRGKEGRCNGGAAVQVARARVRAVRR